MDSDHLYDVNASVSPAQALKSGEMMLVVPEKAKHQDESPPASPPFLHLSEDEEEGEQSSGPASDDGGFPHAAADAKARQSRTLTSFITPPLDIPGLPSALATEAEREVPGARFTNDAPSPESSPGCSPMEAADDATSTIDEDSPTGKDGDENRSEKGSLKRTRSASSVGDSSEEDEELPLPKNLKLPQRKGGMQLWQFLYTLLTDPKKQYSELIQWTDKEKRREFRLQEPEAIAIWWGEHKNKKNMSYDKLSRSLRYYYDKGIIRKIPGERYVYQFCVDPEMMYEHIGISESRPKLKAMPTNAKLAMSKYVNEHSSFGMALEDPYRMMAGLPAPLQFLQESSAQNPHHSQAVHFSPPPPPLVMSSLPPLPPPPPPAVYDSGLPLGFRFYSDPGPVMDDIKPPLALKRHSAPSSYLLESVEYHRFGYDHQFSAPCHQFFSPPMDSFSASLQLHELCPPALSSGRSSPTYMYSSDSDTLELDDLIALTSCDSCCPSPPASGGNSSFCHSINQGEMLQWDFCS